MMKVETGLLLHFEIVTAWHLQLGGASVEAWPKAESRLPLFSTGISTDQKALISHSTSWKSEQDKLKPNSMWMEDGANLAPCD
jgi:hypothetical protein